MSQNNIHMFKASDIRTKFEVLSCDDITDLSKAVARYIKEDLKTDSVVLARDARLNSATLMEKMLEVLPLYGLNVFVNPVQISTCQFYFMCMKKIKAAGIMLTASHNPGAYVGLKIVGPGVSPIATGYGPEGGITRIKEYYSNPEGIKKEKKGKISVYQAQREYVEYSMRLAGLAPGSLEGLSVYADFLSGAAGADLVAALNEAGAEIEVANMVPNGLFPSGDPNPMIESSVAPARERMKGGSYDMGLIFDGDGDRVDLMFPDGSQIIPGLNMAVILPYLIKIFAPAFPERKLNVYADVKAIPLALIEIAKRGVDVHIIRNGHSFIKQKLKDNASAGYIAAEEESAHYYLNFPLDPDDFSKGTVATENTLFFALLSLKAMKEKKSEYERMYEIQKGIIRYREWPLTFNDGSYMDAIMQEVEDKMKAEGAMIIKDMDDGSSLDASLMRFNLPSEFNENSTFPSSWAQVAERISRSEDAMTRWEVVASDQELCNRINDMIVSIAQSYVDRGLAYF